MTQHQNSPQIMSWMCFKEIHMDDLHVTGLEQIQANFSQKIRFKIWTVNEVDTRHEHLERDVVQ